MKKNVQKLLSIVLTVIMMISMLPFSVFAADLDVYDVEEPAVEAVSVPAEEQEIESTVEDVLVEDAEIVGDSSEEIETVDAADPAAADEIEETTEAPVVDDKITLKAEGKDYVVTVTYDASAGLPAGADIKVKELTENNRKYDDYVEQAANTIDSDVEALNYVRLFDISIVDKAGNPVEPNGQVDVKIDLKDVDQVEETTQVVHFAGEEEEPEVVDTTVSEGGIAFATDGFSIYAVLAPTGTGNNARLKVIFKNGTEEIATMYVKKADVDNGKLNEVLYDPGVPVSEDGRKFLGWTDQTSYDTETTRMTINAVREDVKTKLNAGVEEGDEQVYNAIMIKALVLIYQDENKDVYGNGNTLKSESLLTMGDTASTKVNFDYTYKGADPNKGFLGWVVKGTTNPVYQNGDTIEISADTILEPLLGDGCWLVFYENDGEAGTGDASFTPPAFVPAGQTAAAYEPSTNPTWDGYEFAGWYDGPGDDASPFDFSKEYTLPEGETEIPVYAHWTPAAKATYKVIIWTQKVTDDKNAADRDKTYDYFETYSFEVDTGTEITQETIAQFTNYDNARFGVTDLAHGSKAFKYRTYEIKNGTGVNKNCVKADDTTVVNVYYDRQLLKIIFNDDSGTNVDYVEVDHGYTASTVYGDINGQKVALQTNAVKGINFHTSSSGSAATSVGELATVYYKTTTSGNPTHTLTTANINLSNATVGTVYSYYNNTKNTLTNSYVASSTTSYMYASSSNVDSNNRRYAKVYLKSVTYTYNGEPYTGQLYRQVNATVYTGLYGQSFEQNGYEWFMPDSTHPWKNVSYLNSFTGNLYGHSDLGGKANEITLNKSGSTTNFTIYYWVQDAENPSTYNSAGSARYTLDQNSGYNITERFQGMDSSGYRWTTTTSMPTTWNSVEVMNSTTDGIDSQGYTNIKRGSNTALHIRYDRVTNDIIYIYNDKEIGRDRDVPFEQSLESHEQNKPDESTLDIPENQYFAGWYEDPYGDVKVDWENGKMPLANKTIYAVTKPVQYHVVIEMNGGTVPNNQSRNFWVNHGTILDGTNFNLATKSDSSGGVYSLLGYYLEDNTESDNRWRFGTKLTGQSLFLPYDGPFDPAREQYGDLELDPAGNNKWANTVGVFKLFAQWKMDDILSKGGLNIRYTNPEGAPEYEVVDPFHYADITDVVALQAPTEDKWPTGKRFDGWQLREEVVYQPAEVFVAESRDAVVEDDGKYWITLTAVYVDKEEKTPTHITFYKNNGSGGSYITYEDVNINVGYPIYGLGEGQEIPTRDGYTFLGWARDIETPVDGDGNPKTDPVTGELIVHTSSEATEADFLEYKDGKYYLPNSTTEVTQVAADEVLPYHGLYAIWKPASFTIVHSSDPDKPEVITDYNFNGPFDITAKVKTGYIYGGYQNEDGEYPEYGTAMTPVPGATYYLKEVSNQYLVPVVYAFWSRYTKRMQKFYILTDVDSKDYIKVGVDVTGEGSLGNVVFGDDGKTVYKQFTITRTDENGEVTEKPQTKTTNSIFNVDGFLGIENVSEYVEKDDRMGTSITLRAYYVTPDSVKVTGTVEKTINFNNLRYGNAQWDSADGVQQIKVPNKTSDCSPYVVPENKDSLKVGLRSAHKYQIKVASEDAITITKVDNGTKTTQSVKAGDNTGKITNIGKANYVFAGWYEDASYSKVADFANVSKDMTVYAKYVKASTVKLTFTKKSEKAGDVTLKATLKITDQPDIDDVAVDCGFNDTSCTVDFTGVKTANSGKTTVDTYSGTVKLSGLANNSAFTAVISYRTPDGTSVSLDAKSCKYSSGKVTVR